MVACQLPSLLEVEIYVLSSWKGIPARDRCTINLLSANNNLLLSLILNVGDLRALVDLTVNIRSGGLPLLACWIG